MPVCKITKNRPNPVYASPLTTDTKLPEMRLQSQPQIKQLPKITSTFYKPPTQQLHVSGYSNQFVKSNAAPYRSTF